MANFAYAYGNPSRFYTGGRTCGEHTSEGIRVDWYYRDLDDVYNGIYTTVQYLGFVVRNSRKAYVPCANRVRPIV